MRRGRRAGLIVAAMAEEGVVGLDDPLSAHLPAAAAIPRRGRAITLADLASHTSGLPRVPRDLLWRALLRRRADPYGWITPARLEASLARLRPRAPGGRARYSNLGAALLGAALARREGTSYEALVRGRVLGPLGMGETWVDLPGALRPRRAPGHSRGGRPVPAWDLGVFAGAGALVGSAADLLRLAPGLRTGLGWMLQRRAGGPDAAWHNGGTGGFRTMLTVLPETATAAVALATSSRSPDDVARRLLEELNATGG